MSSLICSLAEYYNDCCPEPELSRVSAVAFVRKSLPTFDPEDNQSWKNIICNGHGIIIPAVRGTYNGGEMKEGPGYGRVPTRRQSTNHEVAYMHPYNCDNVEFYNILNRSYDYTLWYSNGVRLWHSTEAVHASAQAPMSDDPSDDMEFNVTAKWVNFDLPYCWNVPSIFENCETLRRLLDCLPCEPITFACN